MDESRIMMAHGGGGSLMNGLIRSLFFNSFDNPVLIRAADAAQLDLPGNRIAFTTDAFVVDPIFFPGGDIGKLAVCGTLNDLAVTGARPLYLSVSFILEEGLRISELKRVVQSMAKTAKDAGVPIVAGDTKVVPKGKGDKIFISTSGVGAVDDKSSDTSEGKSVEAGDCILINGTLGDHGIAVLLQRESFQLHASIQSDCANLYPLIHHLLGVVPETRFMRDATRGGLATVLCELVEKRNFGIELAEDQVPVNPAVVDACELLGMDPLYIANEGKVIMKTALGGKRWIDYLSGDQLPRIC